MISAIVAFISVVTMMIVGSTIFYKQYRAQTDYENQMEQNNINDISIFCMIEYIHQILIF